MSAEESSPTVLPPISPQTQITANSIEDNDNQSNRRQSQLDGISADAFSEGQLIELMYETEASVLPDKTEVLENLKRRSPLARKLSKSGGHGKPKKSNASTTQKSPRSKTKKPKKRVTVSPPRFVQYDKDEVRANAKDESKQKMIERLTTLQQTKFALYNDLEEWTDKSVDYRRKRRHQSEKKYNVSPFRVSNESNQKNTRKQIKKRKRQKELNRIKKLIEEQRAKEMDIEAHIQATVQEELIRKERIETLLQQKSQLDHEREEEEEKKIEDTYDTTTDSVELTKPETETVAAVEKPEESLVGEELTPL
ncbi:hypothetical protein PCE1_001407 [Barthelona sp. PCE]